MTTLFDATGSYAELPLSDIVANPDQPRKHFDTAALEELAQSLREHGLLQPVVVRRQPHGLAYKIIAGERRWRAAKLAGMKSIPCRILEGLDDEQAFVLSILENVNRADMTPSEEGRAFSEVLSTGRTADEVARMFGKSAQYIDHRVTLLNLSARHLKIIDAGQVTISVGYNIAKLSPVGQQTAMNKAARGEFRYDAEAIAFCKALDAADRQEFFMEIDELVEAQTKQRDEAPAVDAANEFDELLAMMTTVTERLRVLVPDITEKPTAAAKRLGLDAVTLTEYLNDLCDAGIDARRVVRRGSAMIQAAQARAAARAAS